MMLRRSSSPCAGRQDSATRDWIGLFGCTEAATVMVRQFVNPIREAD
jgi:hypothetical protein